MVKANAYGHGSVNVSRFLEKHGISHFAVATALEGEELRTAGIHSNIQVFGNKAFLIQQCKTKFVKCKVE